MRPWIISFFIVAIAVGGVLYLMPPSRDGGGSSNEEVAAVQVLNRETVETYIRIQPQIDLLMQEAFRNPERAKDNPAKIYALLQQHGLDRNSWDRIRRSVEDSVVLMRQSGRSEERKAELDKQIELKTAALEGSSEKVRRQIEKDLVALRKLRDEGTIIHESDRALMERYWADLDRIAPRVR